MNKWAFIKGYTKTSSIKKKILAETAKSGKGILEGVMLGGTIGPTAAYLSGDEDDVRKQLILGVAGGVGSGAVRPYIRQLLTSPNIGNKALGYGIMTATGLGTAITSRKLAQKMKLWERRKKWRETYYANKERREKDSDGKDMSEERK